MSLTAPKQIQVPFANSGLRNDIPLEATGSNLASLEEGFPNTTMTAVGDGGMPPLGQDFNGIFYWVTTALRYIQAGGIYPYNEEFCNAIGGYSIGALVRSADGATLWQNQIDGNTNNPDENPTNWKQIQNQLVFDTAPKAGSTNPVTSQGILTALNAKQNTLTFDAEPKSGSNNPVTSQGILTALNKKQNTLVFDNAPTAGSTNPVTSQGIKTAIDAKDSLPSQEGQAGKYLKTDGTTATWEEVSGNAKIVDFKAGDFSPSGDLFDLVIPKTTKLDVCIGVYDSENNFVLVNVTNEESSIIITNTTAFDGYAMVLTAQEQEETVSNEYLVRSVGQYVMSALPLTDAGLHLCDGSILPTGGIYDAFVQYIAGLTSKYPQAFTTETDWQAQVTKYGSCGKFVYSSAGVRLPKVSDILQGTTDISAVGGLIEAGLPNITGSFSNVATVFVSQANFGGNGNALKGTFASASNQGTTDGSGRSAFNMTLDASECNPIYGKSNTVQPQSIKVLLYICVANTAKTDIEVDIDNVATELNGKLNLTGGNISGDLTVQGYPVDAVVESGTNYIRYISGFQLCFGSIGTLNANADYIVTFPKPFNSTPICITCRTSSAGTTSDIPVWQRNASATQLTIYSTGGTGCRWLAIGNWK